MYNLCAPNSWLFLIQRFFTVLVTGLWGSHVFADLCRFEENPRISQLTVVCLPNLHQLSGVITEEQTGQWKGQPQILHTRLSSWLPVERLQPLMTEAVKVAQTLQKEFSYWLRGRVRSGLITRWLTWSTFIKTFWAAPDILSEYNVSRLTMWSY